MPSIPENNGSLGGQISTAARLWRRREMQGSEIRPISVRSATPRQREWCRPRALPWEQRAGGVEGSLTGLIPSIGGSMMGSTKRFGTAANSRRCRLKDDHQKRNAAIAEPTATPRQNK